MNFEQLIQSIHDLGEGRELLQDIGNKNETVFLRALMERLAQIEGDYLTQLEGGILQVVKKSHNVAISES